jgi:hypothetical protein
MSDESRTASDQKIRIAVGPHKRFVPVKVVQQ